MTAMVGWAGTAFVYRSADTAMGILSARAGTKWVFMAIGYVYKFDATPYCSGTCQRVY